MPALGVGNKSQGQLVAGLQLAGIDLRADLGQVAMGIRRGDAAAHQRGEERVARLHGHRVVTQIAGGARHRGARGRCALAVPGRACLSPPPAAGRAARSCCPTRARDARRRGDRGQRGRRFQEGEEGARRAGISEGGRHSREIDGGSEDGGCDESNLLSARPVAAVHPIQCFVPQRWTDVDGSAWSPVDPLELPAFVLNRMGKARQHEISCLLPIRHAVSSGTPVVLQSVAKMRQIILETFFDDPRV